MIKRPKKTLIGIGVFTILWAIKLKLIMDSSIIPWKNYSKRAMVLTNTEESGI